MLLTNNGEIARYYDLPTNNNKRTYLVAFEGNYKNSFSPEMVSGIKFRGVKSSVSKSKLIKIKGQRFTLELTLSEGKNREIRNIAKYFNWNVFKLKRISHGEYNLSSLKSAQLREEKISKSISNNILDIDE